MTTDGKRIEYAPDGLNDPRTTGVMSVALSENEEVEWHWTHGNMCSYVSGYTIKIKPLRCQQE